MFVLEDMMIAALMIVTVIVCGALSAYVIAAILGEWRPHRRTARSRRRPSPSPRRLHSPGRPRSA